MYLLHAGPHRLLLECGLVHGEERAQRPLLERLRSELNAPAHIARYAQKVRI